MCQGQHEVFDYIINQPVGSTAAIDFRTIVASLVGSKVSMQCIVFSYIASCYYRDDSGPEYFMRGVSGCVERQLDIPAIQEWLSKQKAPEERPKFSYIRLPFYMSKWALNEVEVDDQPDSIKIFSNYKPIYLRYDWEEKKFFILRAGTGLMSLNKRFVWQIVIGQSDMPIPTQDEGPYGKKIVEFGPGAYAWYQVHH